MSRVAVCFAGLPRLIPETEESWRRFIGLYNADVFVHTWLVDNSSRELTNKQIVNVLSPKQLLTEPTKKLNISLYQDRIYPHRSEPKNVMSMWYSIRESINLCLNYSASTNKKYDIICRARMDWHCNNLEVIQDNDSITVPDDPGLSGHVFKYKNVRYVAHNDQFGYGKPEHMSIYADTFNQIPNLYAGEYIGFCSELFLTTNLISHNIPIKYQKNLNYRIARL